MPFAMGGACGRSIMFRRLAGVNGQEVADCGVGRGRGLWVGICRRLCVWVDGLELPNSDDDIGETPDEGGGMIMLGGALLPTLQRLALPMSIREHRELTIIKR